MISSICWVKRGQLKPVPVKYQPPEEEMEKFARHLEEEDELPDLEEEGMEEKKKETETARRRRRMEEEVDPELFDDEDDLDDLENFVIRPTDGILIAATSDEEEYSHLDLYIHEEEEDNLYIHHDMLLPSFPLSLAFFDHPLPSTTPPPKSNLVAVGTFEPGIELWDLDIVDSLEPAAVLGGSVESTFDYPKNKKNQKKQELKPGSHTEAILSVAWNKFFRNILTSGSADCSLKFWDLAQLTCLHTYQSDNKVQGLSWHPVESNILLGGNLGGTICLFDVKNPKAIHQHKLPTDIECLQWNPIVTHEFMASTDDGNITCFDARSLEKPLYTFLAHKKSASGFAFNPVTKNFLASVSVDKHVKLWDLNQGQPVCLHKENLDMGKLFCASFYADSPHQLGIGGSNTKPLIYNTSTVSAVTERFGLNTGS